MEPTGEMEARQMSQHMEGWDYGQREKEGSLSMINISIESSGTQRKIFDLRTVNSQEKNYLIKNSEHERN
jgi:hypothetical protein